MIAGAIDGDFLNAKGVRSQRPGSRSAPWYLDRNGNRTYAEGVASDESQFATITMAQSLAQIYVHLVFSTKERRPFLDDRARREEMHRYLGGICNGLECPVLRVGGVADHVHLLCRLSRTIALADLVKEIKRESSLWIKQKPDVAPDFHWQNGYGGFSISPAHVDELCRYIEAQEEHHRSESFQDELRRVLRKYGLEWDERYVWD